MIDEPGGKHYYGGEVAAPVFREILLDLRRLSRDEFLGDSTRVAAPPPSPAPVVVPDAHLLLPDAARRRLYTFGLRARFLGQGPRVLAQQPAAGTETERGCAVTLWLSTPDDSSSRVLPDLTQLPLREALRRLAPLAVNTVIEGRGTVVSQSIEPGTPLSLVRGLRLKCEQVPAPAATSGACERGRASTRCPSGCLSSVHKPQWSG